MKDAVYDPKIQHNVEEDDIHELAALHANISGLADDLAESYDEPPNALFKERIAQLTEDLQKQLAAFNAALKSDVAPFNRAAYAAGAPTVFEGAPISFNTSPVLP